MVVPISREVQKNGVAACVKHLRSIIKRYTEDISMCRLTTALFHEIYLPAFKAAVHEGQAWAIMVVTINTKGEHCCHNQYLLNDLLKRDWGFDGVVVSDWGGVHTKEAIFNGLNMEFGSWTNGLNWGQSNAYDNYYLAHPIWIWLKGRSHRKELNDKVRHILRLVFRTNMAKERHLVSFGTEEHALAGQHHCSTKLLYSCKTKKNVLPVDASKSEEVLVVARMQWNGWLWAVAPSSLKAKYEVLSEHQGSFGRWSGSYLFAGICVSGSERTKMC